MGRSGRKKHEMTNKTLFGQNGAKKVIWVINKLLVVHLKKIEINKSTKRPI